MLTQIEMDTLRQQHFYKKMIELMEQKVALQRECIEAQDKLIEVLEKITK